MRVPTTGVLGVHIALTLTLTPTLTRTLTLTLTLTLTHTHPLESQTRLESWTSQQTSNVGTAAWP